MGLVEGVIRETAEVIEQLLRRLRRALGRIGKAGGQRGQLPHGMGGIVRDFKRLYGVGRDLAALFQQLVQRLGGQGDILLSAPQDIAGHGRAPSRHLTLFYMKSHRS